MLTFFYFYTNQNPNPRMDFNEEKFQAHLKEIVAAGEVDGDRPLTLSELQELANSMGLSDSDWKRLLNDADQNLALAKNHLDARNYVDAVVAADKATAINPYLKDGNSVLAQAYLMQWIDDNDAVKLQKAEFFARKELKVDPNDKEALNVLSTVQNKKRISNDDGKLKKYVLYGIGALIFIFVLGYCSFSPSKADSNDILKNQLIELEENVNAKLELVNSATDRRNNLVPELLKAVNNNGNNSLLRDIENLQSDIETSNDSERIELELELEKKINQAKGLATSGSDKSSLIISIEGAENRINFARNAYNEAVRQFNTLAKQNEGELPGFDIKPYYK
ncbi:MAG: LemA family protein [Crocinitomicaceae bacterium]